MTEAYVHPSADVDERASVGANCAIWNWSKVREGASIGEGSKLGQGVYIDHDVEIGPGAKIQNGVSVYHGVTLGAHVFIGPHATFTNDLRPRAAAGDEWTVVATIVEDDVSIGAHATIVCGVRLGRGCMVGAGAVVIDDVDPFALVVGVPARRVGWVDIEGNRRDSPPNGATPS